MSLEVLQHPFLSLLTLLLFLNYQPCCSYLLRTTVQVTTTWLRMDQAEGWEDVATRKSIPWQRGMDGSSKDKSSEDISCFRAIGAFALSRKRTSLGFQQRQYQYLLIFLESSRLHIRALSEITWLKSLAVLSRLMSATTTMVDSNQGTHWQSRSRCQVVMLIYLSLHFHGMMLTRRWLSILWLKTKRHGWNMM